MQMFKRFINFLNNKIIKECASDVRECNYTNMRIFSILGMILMFIVEIFGTFIDEVLAFKAEFAMLFFYFLIMFFSTFLINKSSKFVTLYFYLWILPIMIMGILMGTYLDPKVVSITILMLICILPLFILDKPIHIILFILVVDIIYIICCYRSKSVELFKQDMVHLMLYSLVSIGVNCLMLGERINKVSYGAKMRTASETDSLTGVANRGAGEEMIKRLIDQGQKGIFCILDIDDFKSINDKYGHAVGDEALKAIAYALMETFHGNDVYLRFGGDEFAVFICNTVDEKEAEELLNHLFANVNNINVPGIVNKKISVSVGASIADNQKSFEHLYKESDSALYQAKRNGKGHYVISTHVKQPE